MDLQLTARFAECEVGRRIDCAVAIGWVADCGKIQHGESRCEGLTQASLNLAYEKERTGDDEGWLDGSHL